LCIFYAGSVEVSRSNKPCPKCDAAPGELHEDGCDVEQCPYCGGQLISCDCDEEVPRDDCMPWEGAWPGTAECREFGWWARRVPGKRGWESCGPDEPGAIEDLNRLHTRAVWDREQKRFRRRRE
jgi:hypothetical protein